MIIRFEYSWDGVGGIPKENCMVLCFLTNNELSSCEVKKIICDFFCIKLKIADVTKTTRGELNGWGVLVAIPTALSLSKDSSGGWDYRE